jgi:hypothetical protein
MGVDPIFVPVSTARIVILLKKTSNILRDVIGMFNAAIDNRKLLALEEVRASQM